jgi:predicted RNA-binding protein (virulence factor B family)
MIKVGDYNELQVLRIIDIGIILDDGKEGILLPKRFAPRDAKVGDTLRVFIYHDSEGRLIATTQTPVATVGQIALMKVVSNTPQGAFLDWGLMKDVFVPRSKQLDIMRVGGEYLVKLYIDEKTGRVVATQKIEFELSNEDLTVKEGDVVQLTIQRKSDIGWVVIINDRHTGVLHFNDVYREIKVGDRLEGFIKNIRPDNKIDVAIGKSGYQRVEEETDKVLRLLKENNGYLPYGDKSNPDDIYAFFGMSKKTFKMTIGSLYKKRLIEFTESGGIKLIG